MKAMIFAAGLGTRLKPLTDTIPKALVPVGGKPLLQHAIEKLKSAGFNEMIINVHHFAEQIIDFLAENNHFGIRIAISDEREMLLETGGGLKKAADFFDDGKPFLIYNVDILCNADLREMYDNALENKALATLLVSKRLSSRYLLFDEKQRLVGWINEKTGETKPRTLKAEDYEKLAFGGIHVVSPEIFELMNDAGRAYAKQDKFSIIDFYLSICEEYKICAYQPENLELIDVGKLEQWSMVNS